METRYYLALIVFAVWVALRLGIFFYRRHARLERIRQQEQLDERETDGNISRASGDDPRP